jgi:hypothetical protein
MSQQPESEPLITSSQAQVAAAAGASAINAASSKIKQATQDGPLTFRIMGFIGGIAMIVSNGLGIVDRFMSFNFTGSLIAIYGCLFGIMSECEFTQERCFCLLLVNVQANDFVLVHPCSHTVGNAKCLLLQIWQRQCQHSILLQILGIHVGARRLFLFCGQSPIH